MQRRLIAAIAAVILAGIGAVLLFNYVATADSRAMAGQQPTEVLVVTHPVKAGATPSDLIGSVEKKQIPAVAVVPGALVSLDQVAGKVTTSALQVGEQVIESRFADPGTSPDGTVQVPDDLQVVSLSLEPARTMGGKLTAGNRVAVYVSYKTKIALAVQNALVVETDPEGKLVTLALKPTEVEGVVLFALNGQVWLAKESKTVGALPAPIDIDPGAK